MKHPMIASLAVMVTSLTVFTGDGWQGGWRGFLIGTRPKEIPDVRHRWLTPKVAKMTSCIWKLIGSTGPCRMSYMKNFGDQAYFLNFPSKFISPGWNGVELNFNPPGGRYGLCLHEVKLLDPQSSKTN